MSVYQTEEEQVEALKKWWKENGRSVIAGAILGFGLIGGWQGWQHYTKTQAESASEVFDQFVIKSQTDADAALQLGSSLINDHEDSTYAIFAALEMAKLKYESGDLDAAKLQLNWVIGRTSDTGLKKVAQLRLAKILVEEGMLQQAQSLIDSIEGEAFAGDFSVVLGDIAVASGDEEAARAAYRKALVLGVDNQQLVEMKLTEIGE